MIKNKEFYQIAIDGPAGAGKSTIATGLSKKLGFTYINSGGLFRCLAIAIKEAAIDINNEQQVLQLLERTTIDQKGSKLYLNGKDVFDQCYTREIALFVPTISKIAAVRMACHETQLRIASHSNVVIEGRDTTTSVFPNALLKVYATALPEIRAERRWLQTDKSIPFQDTLIDILQRDIADMTRKLSPLRKADDALLLDTGGKKVDWCVNFLAKKYQEALKKVNKPVAKSTKTTPSSKSTKTTPSSKK